MSNLKKICYLKKILIFFYFIALPNLFSQSNEKFKYGLSVYKKASCMGCHSWHGKGGHAAGVSLRASSLNFDELVEVINCGRPGSGMPYFNKKSYKEETCYDTNINDYVSDNNKPLASNKPLNKKQILAVAHFIRDNLQGKSLDKSYCEKFFKKGSKVCEKL